MLKGTAQKAGLPDGVAMAPTSPPSITIKPNTVSVSTTRVKASASPATTAATGSTPPSSTPTRRVPAAMRRKLAPPASTGVQRDNASTLPGGLATVHSQPTSSSSTQTLQAPQASPTKKETETAPAAHSAPATKEELGNVSRADRVRFSNGEEELAENQRYAVEQGKGFADSELLHRGQCLDGKSASESETQSITPKLSPSTSPRRTFNEKSFSNRILPLAERAETVFVNLRGVCYVDDCITDALKAATEQQRYRCPVWGTAASLQRSGFTITRSGPGSSTVVRLSSGQTAELFNIEETAEFSSLLPAASSVEEEQQREKWSGNQWSEMVLRHLRQREGVQRSRRSTSPSPLPNSVSTEEAKREWNAVPRNLLGQPLLDRVASALREEYSGFTALQAASPVWLTSSQIASLGFAVRSEEEEKRFVLSPSGGSDEALPRFDAPTVWYNASQLVREGISRSEDNVDNDASWVFDYTSLQRSPHQCMNMDGKPYGMITSFRLRQYCLQWGYTSSRIAIFVTPEKLHQRGGSVLPNRKRSHDTDNSADTDNNSKPLPFTLMAADEVITLWNTEQTSMHVELRNEAFQRRSARITERQQVKQQNPNPQGTQ